MFSRRPYLPPMAQPPILSLDGVGLRQGGRWLFDGLDLHIGPRDALALIGRNGAGKTTLLKLLAGQVEPDRGARLAKPGTHVVLLEQDPDLTGRATLGDWARSGSAEHYEVDAIADQLGVDLDRPATTASGGERRRAAIARALGGQPDLLLLDEPTNHLDIDAIAWLEGWLARFTGAFVVISHDRAFLTRLTKQTLWLDRGAMRRHEVGFGGFEAWAEQVAAEDERNAQRLDARLKGEERWLQRGVTGRRKRNQGRLTQLFEMRAERAAMIGQQGTAKVALTSDGAKSKTVIEATGVTKTYGTRAVIRDLTFTVQRGDRIGIVGPNGAGKTTLIRLMTGEVEPDEGRVRLAKTLNAIVVDQQRALTLGDVTVREVLAEGGDWVDVRGVRTHVIGYLKDFLFAPELVDTPVTNLSGGEKSRLLLAREFAREANLLVLDEPTNDLDLETLDLLQEVVADYDGTVLIVSHDRDFLDRTVNVTLGLDGSGTVDVVAGGYADWAAKRKTSSPSKMGRGTTGAAGGGGASQGAKKAPKLSFNDQRDYDRLPDHIEALTARIAAHEAALADPALYTRSPQEFTRLTDALAASRAEKDAAEERWLGLAEEVEALAG